MNRLLRSAHCHQALPIASAIAMTLAVAACSTNTVPPEKLGTPVAAGMIVPAVAQVVNSGEPAAQAAKLNFTLKDMNGATVELASFKGKPLVLNFWATWCPPCKLEIPWFIELKKQYGAEGLEILGVSIDDSPADLKVFAAEHKMNYPVLVGLTQDKLLETYEAEVSVPVTWFIKKDGTVQNRTIGINSREYFEKQIKALF
jgi:peroxiredoxin